MYIAKIIDDFSRRSVKVVVRTNDHKLYCFKDKKFYEHNQAAVISNKFILEIPREIYDAIAQEIIKDDSVPDKSKDFSQGKLEATEKHLDDMRKLVFDPTNIIEHN